MEKWGTPHFGGDGYDEETGRTTASRDYTCIINGDGYFQNFKVPTEPVSVLLQQPSELISQGTIEAANLALWKMTQFNQLVQQQTDFNARHAAELQEKFLKPERREFIARAAFGISMDIHRHSIGNERLFPRLLDAINNDMEKLDNLLKLSIEEWKPSRGSVPR